MSPSDADFPETLEWVSGGLRILDQRTLPLHPRFLDLMTVDDLVEAISTLAIRGAPALGVAGAYGVAIAVGESQRTGQELSALIDRVRAARPTAVNLAWGVSQVELLVPQGFGAVLSRAHEMKAEDIAANRALSAVGADWVQDRLGAEPGRRYRALTHCNTGGLATAGWGTALGVIRELGHRGRLEHVVADETRPLLQGARLTAWELSQLQIPHSVCVDGAAAALIHSGTVDFAVVGADRVAANGDVANKIGTLGVAFACHVAGVPFVVAAPMSTIDPDTPTGAAIPVEQRSAHEVAEIAGTRSVPQGSGIINPAFDVTPYRYVDAICTEQGIFTPA